VGWDYNIVGSNNECSHWWNMEIARINEESGGIAKRIQGEPINRSMTIHHQQHPQ